MGRHMKLPSGSHWLLLICGLLLAACGAPKEVYVETPVETLYNRAMDSVENAEFEKAGKQFDERIVRVFLGLFE